MKKVTYLFVYLLPITVFVSFNYSGWLAFLPLIVFYILVPLLELLFPANHKNPDQLEERGKSRFYDMVLYLSVPVQVGFMFYFFYKLSTVDYAPFEYVGIMSSMGLMCGIFGINIAHELGHRPKRYEQLMAEILLLTSLEMHFLPYHNNGHHHNVATPNDSATARKGEPVYLFWFRSQISSYFQAWSLENKRLKKGGKSPFSLHNNALSYTLIQLLFVLAIFFFYGTFVMGSFIVTAILGIILLETVNYIEHYGLLRSKNKNDRYERVMHHHSWNSDHLLGRALLFELPRHSDHHYKASKKYQLLQSLPNYPQMPTGYPGMMLFSLIPPLWFWVMNKKLKTF